MITEALFELNAVTISNSNIVHVHTEHKTTNIMRVSYSGSNACPNSDLALSLFALPVTYYHLTWHTHTRADMSELNISMGRLIEVHEVHVNTVPRNLSIILSMEME